MKLVDFVGISLWDLTGRYFPGMLKSKILLGLPIVFLAVFSCGVKGVERPTKTTDDFFELADMRGAVILIPKNLNRVVTISDGLVETVLFHIGELDRVIGLGSSCLQRDFSYHFSNGQGTDLEFAKGKNPVNLLESSISELPLVAHGGTPINFESLLSLRPELVIIRAGSCSFPGIDDEKSGNTLSRLESMGIKVFVLKGPPIFEKPNIDLISEEISLIGQIFGKEEMTTALSSYLDSITAMVKERTRSITGEEKTKVLILGLSQKAREGGSAGLSKGKDTMEGFFIEELVNATNAYRGLGGRAGSLMLNVEQIYALDPDVIILPTASGYHPPAELYHAPYYNKLQQLKAVREKQVFALPWTPCNCAKRVEYPIELLIMAKAAYPNRFSDILIHEWVLGFYEKVYGIDREKAIALRSAQWLDWMVEENF